MEKTIFEVPKMYADHHVEAVRQTLTGLPGVAAVLASAAFKRVVVEYDPTATNPAAIEKGLSAAGYQPGEDWELPTLPTAKEDESPWFQTIWRVTKTNLLDLEMSGDFRKY
jgi:copper chaperone CopZ